MPSPHPSLDFGVHVQLEHWTHPALHSLQKLLKIAKVDGVVDVGDKESPWRNLPLGQIPTPFLDHTKPMRKQRGRQWHGLVALSSFGVWRVMEAVCGGNIMTHK
jgi:hypothetical protein